MNGVPLRGDEHAMTVNWLMIEMISPAGKVTHRNSLSRDNQDGNARQSGWESRCWAVVVGRA